MSSLKIKNLTFSHGKKPIFKDFHQTFGSGLHYITGDNGSGKTTLMKILAKIYPLEKGTIFLDEMSYQEDEVRKYISYIPQDFLIFPNLNVETLLYLIGRMKGLKGFNAKMHEVIEELNLSNYKDVKMKNLSGGTRKRVAIAQALLKQPKLLLADEPTAGLDDKNRKEFNGIIRKVVDKNPNLIVLYSTHIAEDIEDETKISLTLEGEN